MGFAIVSSPRVLNKLALQTSHKAASGRKGLFDLVANRVGRARALEFTLTLRSIDTPSSVKRHTTSSRKAVSTKIQTMRKTFPASQCPSATTRMRSG